MVQERLQQRAMEVADVIFDSQLSLARGQLYLFKIVKSWVSTGKDKGWWKSKKPVIVTDPEEMRAYLEMSDEEREKEEEDTGATYYYLTAKDPSNEAIKDLHDRTYGKPQTNLDITSGGKPIPLLGNARKEKKWE